MVAMSKNIDKIYPARLTVVMAPIFLGGFPTLICEGAVDQRWAAETLSGSL
jgi:hypothetical protein